MLVSANTSEVWETAAPSEKLQVCRWRVQRFHWQAQSQTYLQFNQSYSHLGYLFWFASQVLTLSSTS
jgi:hypothetical protein